MPTVFFHQGFLGFVEAGQGFIEGRAGNGARFRIKNNLSGLENYCAGTRTVAYHLGHDCFGNLSLEESRAVFNDGAVYFVGRIVVNEVCH